MTRNDTLHTLERETNAGNRLKIEITTAMHHPEAMAWWVEHEPDDEGGWRETGRDLLTEFELDDQPIVAAVGGVGP